MQEDFKFPREYYDICSSNFRNKKNTNWFCNKPLSPSQETSVSLSDLSNPEEKPMRMGNTFQMKNEKVTSDNEEMEDDYFNDPDYEFSEHEDFHSDDYSTSIEILSSSGNISSSFDHSQTAEMSKTQTENDSQVERKENVSNSECNNESINEAKLSISTVNQMKENMKSDLVDETKTQKKVFCYFCETLVTNFARHLSRNQSVETEVQKILALPPLSSRRLSSLSNLRKKGKYLLSNTIIKPVRRGTENSKFLHCVDCLGYHSVKNLWRHRKQCSLNLNKHLSGKRVQGEAQNFLLRNLKVDCQLQTYVFPRMRADKISLIAKRDQLICEFASRYLKIHREKHSIPVASRKMRELGRLLFEIKKLEPSIDCLCTALHPKHYDILVTATKNAAKFDTDNQTYMSPTYALQMGTTLKQCCDIALLHALKKSEILASVQSATSEADLKTLIQLITGNWKFDVSSQAASDLNLQKWNKISMVPLASDLKLLKDHLLEMAKKSLVKLEKDNRDCNAYTTLLETIYCRLLLLNRRRPGELQRLLLQTYESVSNMQNKQEYEEFSEAISETEKFLMKKFKRIVIRGKRGRGVPVLISEIVQEHMDVILKMRKNFYAESNICLFGKPNSTEPIVGYKVMKKYATKCGSKNPDALTCTKLRKHLATLTQLFNMSENDMEQLASFMGHTLGIHRSSYRLPDDVYQTARISKLLILMEKGEAGQFKGKSLDEIDLNLEQNLMDERDEHIEERTSILSIDDIEEKDLNEKNEHNSESKLEFLEKPVEKRRRLLVAWTEEQKIVVREYFKQHVKEKRPPKKHECITLKSLHANLLINKDWPKIKVFIQNEYKKLLTSS